MRWVEHVAHMGEMRNVYKILVGKSEAKRPVRIPRHRWGDNVKMDLRKIGFGVVDWIHMVQDRYWWRALGEHGNEHFGSIKGGEIILD
jgi:hypothetical protein